MVWPQRLVSVLVLDRADASPILGYHRNVHKKAIIKIFQMRKLEAVRATEVHRVLRVSARNLQGVPKGQNKQMLSQFHSSMLTGRYAAHSTYGALGWRFVPSFDSFWASDSILRHINRSTCGETLTPDVGR
ncbi:hypothetical protein HOY80DRAFT_987563 [Tuber brumale]|nr:hypothetical protein HOY80DRAFT_987563 [Tuber brumale]